VTTGKLALNVTVKDWLAVPAAFVAMIVALKTPFTVGVPEIAPVEVLTDSPAGKPEAPKLIGIFPAVIR
jgi:hypothetical protein